MLHVPKQLDRVALVALMMLVLAGCTKPNSAKKTESGETPANTTDTATAEPAKTEPAPAVAVSEPAKADAAVTPTAAAPAEKPAEKPAEEPLSLPVTAAKSAETESTNGPGTSAAKVILGSPELTAGIPGEGPLKLAEIEAWLADPKRHEPLQFELPLGLSAGAAQVQGLDKNPMTLAKIELGRQLYFDPRLSADNTISCATCHNPDQGYAAHTQFGVGIRGLMGGRNSPVSYNRILSGPQFWDGRADSLEAQAVGPIANEIEMGHTHDACVKSLKSIPGYEMQFNKIFGKLDIDAVGAALATFERAIVTAPSPFDYYERYRPFESQDPDDLKDDPATFAKYEIAAAEAKKHPLTESARRGRDLFFSDKASCTACHVGPNLSDEKYHNLGVGMDQEKPDVGREAITKDPKDHGAFKTPTIRNVATSAPYMHNGTLKTLEEVVEWYAKGGHPNPSLSEKIKKLDLTEQDKKDLVEFMTQGCTSDFPKVERGRLPE